MCCVDMIILKISRSHVSKMHTKESMEKICPHCNIKTTNLEYHSKIYHHEVANSKDDSEA